MQSNDLYQRILGLSAPWQVSGVELNVPGKRVSVRVEHDGSPGHTCPECGKACPGYDGEDRSWRHLDTCQMQTILTARVPRVECPEHGVRVVKVPWAEPGARFTALFEALVIDWLKEASIKAVAEQLDLTWDQVDGMMSRAVKRGLARRETMQADRIGVDETSFKKRHTYVTVVADLDGSRVLHVGEGRQTETLEAWYRTLNQEQLAALKVVAMDMWEPYIQATHRHVPRAEERIVFDKFDVASHLGDALDKVRRGEHRELMESGDDRLKGTKHLWLSNPGTLTRRPRKPEVMARFERLRTGALRTARAYSLKEAAMELWSQETRGEAQTMWKWWHSWAVRSRLEPMKKVARMIKSHLTGILNAIETGATNAMCESLNSKIQKVKRLACGFRNGERFRNAIYFHLGGLQLYPATLTHSNA